MVFNSIRLSFSTVYKTEKRMFYFSVLNSIINITKVYVLAYANKLLINELSIALMQFGNPYKTILPVAKLVLFNWIVLMLYNLINKIIQNIIVAAALDYDEKINIEFCLKTYKMDISYFDTPDENDKVTQSYRDMSALLSVFENTLVLISSFISFCIACVIIVKFNLVITLIIIVSVLPSFLVKRYIKKSNYNLERSLTRVNRKSDYFAWIFRGREAAQDIRLSVSFKDMVLEKYSSLLRDKNFEKKLHIKNSKIDFCVSVLYGLLDMAINLHILFEIIYKKLTIGEFSYYTTITSNLKGTLEGCINTVSELVILCNRVENYRLFITQPPKVVHNGNKSVNSTVSHTIEFQNVSFKYPNSNSWILTNINFKFNTEEKIAFTGINGSGKTTLIKLLLRYYDPSNGVILLDGVDIKLYDIVEYRKIFSVMFQNYMNYCITISENVAFSSNKDNKKVWDALCAAELFLPHSNKTVTDLEFSKKFDENGIVLSAGQSQRLSLSRAIYRDSQVYIFDEPSASLDAKSEKSVFDKLFEITRNKGVILISHRLSNLKNMDKIVCITEGKIEAIGTHEQLLLLDCTYSKMYQIQMNGYI